MHFPFNKPWVTVDAPIDNLGYPKENQRPSHAKGHSYIIFWQMKVKIKSINEKLYEHSID